MELKRLGFDEWFEQKQTELDTRGCRQARVTAVNKDNYMVMNEEGEILAELAGEFRFSRPLVEYPVVGDWTLVKHYNCDELAIIYDLLPRKTLLRRKAAGKKVDYQVIACNINNAFIIQSCDHNFSIRRLERYLVMVREGNIKPVIMLSKSDLISREEMSSMVSAIRSAHIDDEIITYSILSGAGLSQVRQALEPGKTYCLLGSSGVGKTTLLNYLLNEDKFNTNLVRAKDGKGRHTTSRRQMVMLEDGAMIIDTPGMRELGNIDITTGLEDVFADIARLADNCRFNDCTHTSETGCAVLEAVVSGTLSEARYQSYLKLLRESEHHQMSYAEKREKDRKLGKFYKSVLKEMKRINKR